MLKHIIDSFDSAFKNSHQTILLGGGKEPFYQPRQLGEDCSIVYFREDFISSALHEIAHWCLAGAERRKKIDYGYWYESGRDEKAQISFEAVEVKPQSIEWILSTAAGIPFSVSADNLDLKKYCNKLFRQKVHVEANRFLLSGLPGRVRQIAKLLSLREQSLKDDAYLCLDQYRDLPQ